ncbi:MAG: hypothetical protein HY885_06375 [Deltaproteobacteria bacterium]|nr:hypothetical protein [Deltaproteobacteria bacterium]
MRIRILSAAVCLAALMPSSVSRAGDDLHSRLDRLDAELRQQGEIIREQQKIIQALKEELNRQQTRELTQPKQETQAPAATAKATGFFGGNVLTNPNVGLVLDTFAYTSNLEDDELENRGIAGFTTSGLEPRQGFNLRAAELFIFAPVDPYFNLYANLPITEDGVELEEVYAVTTALPAGLQVKGGKFKSNFSRLDAQHPHVWDFYDIALPYRAFLGDEGLGGEKGVQLTCLPAWPVYTQFGVEVLQGENDLLFGADGASGPHAYSLFVKNSMDITDNSTLYFGPSVLFGKTRTTGIVDGEEFAGDSALYGLEGVWKWKPDSRQGFTLQSEYLYLDQHGDLTDETTALSDSLRRGQDGFYVQGMYQLGRWRFGARYDMLELFADRFELAGEEQELGETPWRASTALEFNLSEFTRLRFQFTHDRSGRDDRSNNEGVLQLLFGIGAHAAHSF